MTLNAIHTILFNMHILYSFALAVWAAWVICAAFRSHANWMNFEADDFFYYLKIAQNLAHGDQVTRKC